MTKIQMFEIKNFYVICEVFLKPTGLLRLPIRQVSQRQLYF